MQIGREFEIDQAVTFGYIKRLRLNGQRLLVCGDRLGFHFRSKSKSWAIRQTVNRTAIHIRQRFRSRRDIQSSSNYSCKQCDASSVQKRRCELRVAVAVVRLSSSVAFDCATESFLQIRKLFAQLNRAHGRSFSTQQKQGIFGLFCSGNSVRGPFSPHSLIVAVLLESFARDSLAFSTRSKWLSSSCSLVFISPPKCSPFSSRAWLKQWHAMSGEMCCSIFRSPNAERLKWRRNLRHVERDEMLRNHLFWRICCIFAVR